MAALVAATIFLVLSPRVARLRPSWLEGSGLALRWILPGLGIAFVAGGFAGPRLVTGDWLPSRVVGANYTVFLIAWFVSIFSLTRRRTR